MSSLDQVWTAVAAGAAADAGGLDPALLGDFLPVTTDAAGTGRRLRRRELERYAAQGRDAALAGVALRALVDLYLSAAWRLWAELPLVAEGDADAVRAAGLAVLRAADDGVAALVEGFQLARNELSRRLEAERREVLDALLEGGRSAAGVLGRAADLGLQLTSPTAVLVAEPATSTGDGVAGGAAAPVLGRVEEALAGRRGDAVPLLALREGRLLCVFAAPDAAALALAQQRVQALLGPGWSIAVGRALRGPEAVRTSFEQARDTLALSARLGVTTLDVADLAVYRVLLRDRAAVTDLIATVLEPLRAARGGPEPLLRTLEAWFATGGNATATARRLHLSVRAVTYRLDRVRQLLGRDPADPSARFALQAAVLGARLLDWPRTELDEALSLPGPGNAEPSRSSGSRTRTAPLERAGWGGRPASETRSAVDPLEHL